MSWLGLVLVLSSILVLFGGAFYAVNPARGERATEMVRQMQDRMESHPIRSFYIPLAIAVAGTIGTIPRIFAVSSLEGQITAAAIASIPMLGGIFTVRIRRWP
jgi:hypothetical protein